MVFPMPGYHRPAELTADQMEAMHETVARVREVLAELAERERRSPQGLAKYGRLSKSGVDAALGMMGLPPVSDEEWTEIQQDSGDDPPRVPL
ncbi:hypothetical protein ACFY05_26760 [Microtetraspora fusca]|uniref:Uncharacterized protein n=1 Tax=Microtetraspora fusca TaxID=1997 RepID=A0ABW6VDU9_MICFU